MPRDNDGEILRSADGLKSNERTSRQMVKLNTIY